MNVHISSVDISSPKRKTEAHGVLVKTLKFVSLKLLKGTFSFHLVFSQTTNFFSFIEAFCSNADSVALGIDWSV